MRETKRKLLEMLTTAKRAGKRSPATARPGKGNTLLNYCGIRDGLHRLHRRPEPVQAGQVPARHAHPDLRAREARRGAARLHLHPPVEPQGRDHGAAGPHPELGRQVHRSRPGSGRDPVIRSASLGAPGTPLRILCLGAHCDDIEIGCGGTVLRLLAERPGSSVTWVALTSKPTGRRRRAPGPRLFWPAPAKKEVVVGSFRDGFLPFQGAEVKEFFEPSSPRSSLT